MNEADTLLKYTIGGNAYFCSLEDEELELKTEIVELNEFDKVLIEACIDTLQAIGVSARANGLQVSVGQIASRARQNAIRTLEAALRGEEPPELDETAKIQILAFMHHMNDINLLELTEMNIILHVMAIAWKVRYMGAQQLSGNYYRSLKSNTGYYYF